VIIWDIPFDILVYYPSFEMGYHTGYIYIAGDSWDISWDDVS